MLAFVNCSHFPVKIPDVPVWGITLENLVNHTAQFLQQCSMNHQHPKPLACSLKMQIRKRDSMPTELGDGGLEYVIFERRWMILTNTQIGEYTRYTQEKGPGLHNQMDLRSEPRSTRKPSCTATWNAKGFTHMEKQFDSFLQN